MEPLISIIVPTFNRAKTIERTIDSVLTQTYQNFEVIIVDDGSEDNTSEILHRYTDNRIRIFRHEHNKGVTAAKNTGLDNIKGEWFTILDSDDEIKQEALDLMIKIPIVKDPTITAITCNCTDTSTDDFSGRGLTCDGYLDFNTLITKCEGEFWGITKTELLLNDRFNDRLWGFEDILWIKMSERANRYYIHQALRIYHTEGDDRVSNVHFSLKKTSHHYQVLSEEAYYLQIFKKYWPNLLAKDCLRAIIYLKVDGKNEFAKFYFNFLKKIKKNRLYKTISFFAYYSHPSIIRKIMAFGKFVRLRN